MKIKSAYFFLLFFVLLIQGCAPSSQVTTVEAKAPLSGDCQPRIFLPADQPPGTYETLATVKYGDAGLSVHCGKDDIRMKMREEACKAGANGILIKKEKNPSLVSTCYRVTADLISY